MKSNYFKINNIKTYHNKRFVLVIYDIVDSKKRIKIASELQAYGRRVQKSAFEMVVNDHQLSIIVHSIKKMVTEEDTVRIYKFKSYEEVIMIGNNKTLDFEEIVVL